MALIEDTNQKIGQHTAKNEYWETEGEVVIRNKLPFGDYVLAPKVSVDTKKDILELAANINNDHERFKRSMIKAHQCGSRLVFLVENTDGVRSLDDLESWMEPLEHFRIRERKAKGRCQRFNGSTLAKACRTMNKRYGGEFMFCTPEEAGQKVLEILHEGET